MTSEINKNDYLTLEQVRELTGVSQKHLDSFISNGDLETIQIDDELYVPKIDFKVFELSLKEGRAIVYSALHQDHISLQETPELSEEEIAELDDL